jgi:hypothetical protein
VCHQAFVLWCGRTCSIKCIECGLFEFVAEIQVIIVTVITSMSTNENLLLILLDHMRTCGHMHAQTSGYLTSAILWTIFYIKKTHKFLSTMHFNLSAQAVCWCRHYSHTYIHTYKAYADVDTTPTVIHINCMLM